MKKKMTNRHGTPYISPECEPLSIGTDLLCASTFPSEIDPWIPGGDPLDF